MQAEITTIVQAEVDKSNRNYLRDPLTVEPNTPLITSGILDSMAVIDLVMKLEDRFGVVLKAEDYLSDKFDTVTLMTQTVERVRAAHGQG